MRRTFNGTAVDLQCRRHPDIRVTLYGLPSSTAWCPCGREMKPITKTHSMRRRRG